jgi:hypothetical protein
MREFKFRAWDKKNKKMLYDGFVLNPDGSIGTVNNDDQWTGLIVM